MLRSKSLAPRDFQKAPALRPHQFPSCGNAFDFDFWVLGFLFLRILGEKKPLSGFGLMKQDTVEMK